MLKKRSLPLALLLILCGVVGVGNAAGITPFGVFGRNSEEAAPASGKVLAATDGDFTGIAEDLQLEVNIPAVFNSNLIANGPVSLTGSLEVDELIANLVTAPNLLYGLEVEGEGLEIIGSQNLLIANTDPGSAQEIFKNIKLGGDTISAGSNTDTLEFAAGSDISLSIDKSNKRITISNSYSSPWSEGSSTLYPAATTTKVAIGTTTADYTLHVAGTGYVNGDFTVDGDTYLNGNVTLGDSTTDDLTVTGRLTTGTAILPDVDLGADLGSASLRFNNLYVANLNSNSGLSTAGQSIFTYEPTSTAYTQASVMINPTAPADNGLLQAWGVAGYERAGIDEDGDLTLGYNDAISAPASDYPLNIYGHNGTRVAYIDESGNANFSGSITVGQVTGSFTQGSILFAGSGGLFSQDNSNFFWDDTNNRLGIGTTSPSNPLSVLFSSSSTTLPGVALTNSNASGKAQFQAQNSSGTTLTMGVFGSSFGSGLADTSHLAGSGSITLISDSSVANGGSSPISFRTGGYSSTQERMRITSSGYVGIGTTIPTSLLHLNGGVGSIANGIAFGDGDTGFYEVSDDNINVWVNGAIMHRWTGSYYQGSSTGYYALRGASPSAAFPSYSFVSDNDTGMWRPNADELALVTGGSNRLFINSTGLVGIGTDSPTAKLHVNGGYGANDAFTVNQTLSGNILSASASGTTRMVLTNAGDLGIGTSVPAARFNVEGGDTIFNNASADYDFTVLTTNTQNTFHINGATGNIGIGTTSPGRQLTLYLNNSSAVPQLRLQQNSTGDASMEFLVQGGQVWHIGTDNSDADKFKIASALGLGGGSDRLTIDTSGNVGIGTTSTSEKLQVEGNMRLRHPSNGSTNTLYITNGNGTHTIATNGYAFNFSTINNAASVLTFVNGSERMRITNSGNIGIGTTDPTTLLDLESAAPTLTINASTDGNDASIVLQEAATTKWSIFNDGDNSDTLFITDAEGDQGVSLAQGATSWAAASDITLKENVKLVEGSLDKVKQLNGYYYNFIGGSRTEVGLVAQEVQNVLPELVVQNKNGKLAVMYDRLAPVLVNAIKEQQVQIDSLGNLTTIETRLAAAEKLTAENKTAIDQLRQTVSNLFNNTVTFLAGITVKGPVTLTDSAGTLTINPGSTKVKVNFNKPFAQTPSIYLTPATSSPTYQIVETTPSYFIVQLNETSNQPVVFNWLAILQDGAEKVEVLDSASPLPTPTATPTPATEPSPSPVATPSSNPNPPATEAATVNSQ